MMLFDCVRKPLLDERQFFAPCAYLKGRITFGRKGSLRYELISMLGVVLGATVCEHSRRWSVRLLLLRLLPPCLTTVMDLDY